MVVICKICSFGCNTQLQSHFIPRRENKDLLYEITNGVTLCVPCHRKTFGREYEFVEIFSTKVHGRIAS